LTFGELFLAASSVEQLPKVACWMRELLLLLPLFTLIIKLFRSRRLCDFVSRKQFVLADTQHANWILWQGLVVTLTCMNRYGGQG
jgi:hypothetical protein